MERRTSGEGVGKMEGSPSCDGERREGKIAESFASERCFMKEWIPWALGGWLASS